MTLKIKHGKVNLTKTLIKTVERRYKQLGGILPISQKLIEKKKGQKMESFRITGKI